MSPLGLISPLGEKVNGSHETASYHSGDWLDDSFKVGQCIVDSVMTGVGTTKKLGWVSLKYIQHSAEVCVLLGLNLLEYGLSKSAGKCEILE